MFEFFRRHRTVVLVALALCILGLLLFGVGGTSFMASPQDVVVRVNGQELTAQQFDNVYRAMMRQRPDASAADQQEMMGLALNELIRQEVLSVEAERYGITVTDEELRNQLAGYPAFQRDGRFDPATYVQVVQRSFGMPPHEFEKNHKKDIAVRKLNLLIASAVQVSDAEVEAQKASVLGDEKDAKARKELESKPGAIRERVRERQINLVFSDWLNRLNSDLKVSIVNDQFRQRLGAPVNPAK